MLETARASQHRSVLGRIGHVSSLSGQPLDGEWMHRRLYPTKPRQKQVVVGKPGTFHPS
jgi:hypothetical protein